MAGMITLGLRIPSQPPVGSRCSLLESNRTSSEVTTYAGVEMPKTETKVDK